MYCCRILKWRIWDLLLGARHLLLHSWKSICYISSSIAAGAICPTWAQQYHFCISIFARMTFWWNSKTRMSLLPILCRTSVSELVSGKIISPVSQSTAAGANLPSTNTAMLLLYFNILSYMFFGRIIKWRILQLLLGAEHFFSWRKSSATSPKA